MILTPPAMTVPVPSMAVKSIESQPKRLQPCKAKSTKAQPVKLMSFDHRPDVIFDAIEQDEAAWGMYACVDTRLGNLIDCRGTYNERCQLQRKYLGDWFIKWPNEPIVMAAVRLSGLTWEQYAAKHPNLPYELLCCWEWENQNWPDVVFVNTEISAEAARIMRHTNLLIRLIKKSRMKKSKKYQRCSRMQTLHYRAEETA